MEMIRRGKDGYYHPATEEELRQLVVQAHEQGRQIRVRGSAHSVTQAIYTDAYDGEGDPPGEAMDVMLDRYRAVTITPDPGDPTHALVEVEAGCNLGKNPYDPTHTSTWENSLNYKLQQAGYALDDLGGITHQTISGFMSTGSSGGSLTYAFENDLVGIRLIDGTGKVWDLRKDDPDPEKRDLFAAAGVSMGLLGVISRVWLRVGPQFNLFGSQVTSTTDQAGIDFYGTGKDLPTFEQFLRWTPYTRLMWWPQHGLDRMTVWQASRIPVAPGFTPQPYLEMGRAPQIEALAGSLFYTVIGNLSDISAVPGKLGDWYAHLDDTLSGARDPNACPAELPGRKLAVADVLARLRDVLERAMSRHAPLQDASSSEHGAAREVLSLSGLAAAERALGAEHLPRWLAELVTKLFEKILDGAFEDPLAQKIASWLEGAMPWLIRYVLEIFITLGTQYFWDCWRCGLPMDNQMDDQLWDTEFTELWIPIEQATSVMQALRDFYAAGGDPVLAYQHTGAFSCEIYAASKSPFWMSPSYGTDVIRIDVFWFGLNAGSPTTQFYPQFWELLKGFGYRPHWGKYLGPPSNYLGNLPRLGDFLDRRAKLDPGDNFLSDYWQDALGIATGTPVDLMAAVPTGRFALKAGARIVLGVQKDGADLDIGEGVVSRLDARGFAASGTYRFEYEGKRYAGTWSTKVCSTNGVRWVMTEAFTGSIDDAKTFVTDASLAGEGSGATIVYTAQPLPNVVQSFENYAPGQKAMLLFLGVLPVFGYVNGYYYDAAQREVAPP